MTEAGLRSCVGDTLAGEASGKALHPLKVGCSDCSYVVEDGDSGEALGEDSAPPLVSLDEPAVLESREMEPVIEESDSTKDRSESQLTLPLPPAPGRRRVS